MSAQIVLDGDLQAYSETAELVLRPFQKAGLYAMLQLHINETLATAIVLVHALPMTVKAVLEQHQLHHTLIDFHDTPAKTAATYTVPLMGRDIAVVAVRWHDAQQQEAA